MDKKKQFKPCFLVFEINKNQCFFFSLIFILSSVLREAITVTIKWRVNKEARLYK